MKRRRWDLLFLKAFSWETDLWVTQGDFALKNKTKQNKTKQNKNRNKNKKRKIEKVNLKLTKIRLGRNKFDVQKITTIKWVKCVQKNSQIQKLLAKIWHIFKVTWIFLDQLLLPYYPMNIIAVAWEEYL